MPQWKKLPDGSWGFVPDTNPFIDQLTRSRQVQAETSLPGSVVEAFKALPSGFVDVPASMLEAAIGVATPHIDLPLEQRLRAFANRRQQEGFMFKRDPAYRDAFLPKVGMGLGQAGAFYGLARFGGPYGMAASLLAGVGLGISDQTRRMAQKEQQTGVDIPWYKESIAHLLGGTIGLTESLPIARLLRGVPGVARNRNFMHILDPKAMPRTTAGQIRSALGGVAYEGVQEGLAQGLQSATARGLYDPDALNDIVASMVEEAKVGGVVGGIMDYLATSMSRYNRRGGSFGTIEGTSAEAELRHGRNRINQSAEGQKYIDQISSGLVTARVNDVLDAYNVDESLKNDIAYVFNGEYAALPDQLQALLQDGGLDVSTLRSLRNEFKNRTDYTVQALERAAESAPQGSSRAQQLREAARATSEILSERLRNMDDMLESRGYGWTGLGGLTSSRDYQNDKGRDTPYGYSALVNRARERRAGQTSASYRDILEDFQGGAYGRTGLFTFAEQLGVHNGPGAQHAAQGTTPSSSDRANFSLSDIGKVAFGALGGKGTLGGIPYNQVDVKREAEALAQVERQIRILEEQESQVLESFPLVRALAEEQGAQYTSDREWETARDQNAETVLLQRGRLSALLGEQNQLRDTIYADLLLQRLKRLQSEFASARDPEDAAQKVVIDRKQALINELGLTGTPKTPDAPVSLEEEAAFDNWLDQTIKQVEVVHQKGVENQAAVNAQIEELDRQLDAAGTDEGVRSQIERELRPKLLSDKRPPRDITAEQMIRIVTLFEARADARKDAIDQRLEQRAGFDIADWQVRNSRAIISDGLSRIDPSVSVVRNFVEKVLPGRQAKNSDRLVTESDIRALLKTKNIFLRGDAPRGPSEGALETTKNIGTPLEKRIGTGVKSRPFESLLKNLTGARSWAEATPGQQMMMYARLLQLPPQRINPSSDPDTGFTEGEPEVEFEPLMLPMFEQNPVMDAHVDAILDDDVLTSEQAQVATPNGLRRRVKARMGDSFVSGEFDEALASLIESGLFNYGTQNGTAIVRVPRDASIGRLSADAHREFVARGFDPRAEIAPGEDAARVADRIIYQAEVKPRRLRELLSDQSLDAPIQEARARWNSANPNDKLSKEQFVERFGSFLQSEFGLQELVDLGLMESVGGRMKRAERLSGVESVPFIDYNTDSGSKILNALISSGSIPSSTNVKASAVRRAHIQDVRKRFEAFKIMASKRAAQLRLPGSTTVQFVDNADGLFQGISEVMVRGEMLPETQKAVYDSASNRIIINLAAIDPNNILDALTVIDDSMLHEGIHALIMRDHLYESELQRLGNFVRKQVVPEEVDANAHELGVTWFEKKVYDLKDSNLSEGDIEHEAIVSLMEALVQDKVPEARKGTMRKTKGRLSAMFESVVGAAKDADITDVMQILAEVESGRIGERGSGYMGDTKFDPEKDEIRSLQLSRYADPAELERLTKAIALRDAAPSGAMRNAEQLKVDGIVETIVSRRSRIQESVPPVSDLVAIDDEREAVQEVRDTNSYAIPLVNGQVWTSPDNPEARRAALNEYLKTRRGEQGYVMPREWMDMFDAQTDISPKLESLVSKAVQEGKISERPKRGSFIEGLKKKGQALRGDRLAGDTVEETISNMERQISPDPKDRALDGFRYNFLDRRQWLVKQTDRILQLQNRAQVNAETSALVAFRNADNAVNYFPSIMKLGPLSYLGIGTGRGQWDVSPIYDEQLREKYGGDGRVSGLLDIFSPVSKPKDEQAAGLYGNAKRIRWTRKRRDDLRKALGPIPEDLRDPELSRMLEMFEESYDAINPITGPSQRQYSEQDLDSIITEVEANNPRIVEFWDNYQAFNRAMLETAYRAQLITLEQRNEWQNMPFTPFYRDTSPADGSGDLDPESSPIGSAGQFMKRGRTSVEKALKGSLQPVDSRLMENITNNIQALVRDSMMNVAVARTVRDALALGTAKQVALSDLAASADTSVVRVMEGGVAKYYRFDDVQLAMSTMMLGFNPKKNLQDLFGGGMAGRSLAYALTGSSQLLRETVTKTPPFQFKNIFRDSWSAGTIVGGGPLLVLDSVKAALNPDTLRRAEEAGLTVGIDFVGERGEILSTAARRQLAQKDLDWKNPINGVASLWTFLDRIAKQSEVATRVAVHDRVLAMTGDRALAQYLAIEIMNYGRRGANQGVSTFLATVPFMNGRLQGLDVIARGFRSRSDSSDLPSLAGFGLTQDEYMNLPWVQKNLGQIFSRGFLLATATGLMYMMFHDDEEYQNLRAEVKSDNWVLPLSDHAWLKVPIPFEVGVLFKVIPEQITMALLEADHDMGDVGEEVVRQLRTSLSIGGPQLITPLYNAARNYDAFRKDAIVDQWTSLREPSEQREMYTSKLAGGLADLANSVPLINKLDFLTSPMKVEFLMRQYLGTMGMYGVTIADRVGRSGHILGVPLPGIEPQNIVGTNVDFGLRSLVGGEGVANVPILGDLLIDPRTRAGAQQDFYDILEELGEITATMGAISERDLVEGFTYERKNIGIVAQRDLLNAINRDLKAWREERDMLLRIPASAMSDDEKRRRYQRLLDQRALILGAIKQISARAKGNR